MTVKELKDIINNLVSSYNDHIIVINADRCGIEEVAYVDTNAKFIDHTFYGKSLYEPHKELDSSKSTPCILLGV